MWLCDDGGRGGRDGGCCCCCGDVGEGDAETIVVQRARTRDGVRSDIVEAFCVLPRDRYGAVFG